MVREFPTMIRALITAKQVAQKGFHLLKSILDITAKSQLKIQVKMIRNINYFQFALLEFISHS